MQQNRRRDSICIFFTPVEKGCECPCSCPNGPSISEWALLPHAIVLAPNTPDGAGKLAKLSG